MKVKWKRKGGGVLQLGHCDLLLGGGGGGGTPARPL